MANWQPIETLSPTYGDKIWAYCSGDHQIALEWVHCVSLNHEFGMWSGRDDAHHTHHKPTHWMPLPEPPAPKEMKDGE